MRVSNKLATALMLQALEGYSCPQMVGLSVFLSFELNGDNLKYLNPSGKKTAIFQCEFFAVLVALKA